MRVLIVFYGVYPNIYGVYPKVLWSLPERFMEFTRIIWNKYATLDLFKIYDINI